MNKNKQKCEIDSKSCWYFSLYFKFFNNFSIEIEISSLKTESEPQKNQTFLTARYFSDKGQTHQQNGWKSVNFAQPLSSASVAAGWETGVSHGENGTPAAGAVEFTSPKSATQPTPGGKKV